MALLCVAIVNLSVSTALLKDKWEEQLQIQETMYDEITDQKNVINEQTDKISKLEQQLETQEEVKIKYKKYIVKKGDTLSKICKNNNIDYYKNLKIILAINNIENPNEISIGQIILLPVEK